MLRRRRILTESGPCRVPSLFPRDEAGSAGLEQIQLEYDEALPHPDNGEGYLRTVRHGAGETTTFAAYDCSGNATRVESSAGSRELVVERLFDAWDRAYQVTVAPGGGEGVEETTNTRYDLSGRPVKTTRTQRGVGVITTTTAYNERGQVTSVTTTGHAGAVGP
jgi:hypothetical protein